LSIRPVLQVPDGGLRLGSLQTKSKSAFARPDRRLKDLGCPTNRHLAEFRTSKTSKFIEFLLLCARGRLPKNLSGNKHLGPRALSREYRRADLMCQPTPSKLAPLGRLFRHDHALVGNENWYPRGFARNASLAKADSIAWI